MPGGSVNGRPFREGPDSYTRTGIPCGNPKRYQSRDVIKMGVQNQNALSKALNGPVEDIETESDRQLQHLLGKQLNTKITLKEQFKQHKKFSDGVSHMSATDSLSGTVSLNRYRGLSQLDTYITELKHCGLTEEEVELKLEDMGHTQSKKLRLNLEPGIRDNKLRDIEEKIKAKKKQLEEADLFSGARRMGRHEMDLERAISQNSDKAKLLSCLLTTSRTTPQDLTSSQDPMDHLPEILDIVTRRSQTSGTSAGRRRKRCDKDNYDTGVPNTGVEFTGEGGCVTAGKDVCDARAEVCPGAERTEGVGEATGTALSKDTEDPVGCSDTPSAPRALCGKIDSIPEADIIRERLSVPEIRQIPRFKGYTPGQPTQVLYVKNLPVKVREEDLVRLFIRFQKAEGPQIQFKLMTGRMRGQAFITFDSVTSATEALDLINGYNFKGKPIIIQYGKKAPADT